MLEDNIDKYINASEGDTINMVAKILAIKRIIMFNKMKISHSS